MVRIDFSKIPKEISPFPWEVVINQDFYWMDRYGRKHPISEMEERYLRNCIPFIAHACTALYRHYMSIPFDEAEREAYRYEDWTQTPLGSALLRAIGEWDAINAYADSEYISAARLMDERDLWEGA